MAEGASAQHSKLSSTEQVDGQSVAPGRAVQCSATCPDVGRFRKGGFDAGLPQPAVQGTPVAEPGATQVLFDGTEKRKATRGAGFSEASGCCLTLWLMLCSALLCLQVIAGSPRPFCSDLHQKWMQPRPDEAPLTSSWICVFRS